MPDDPRDNRFFFFVGVGRFRRQAVRIHEAAKECETKEEAMELYAGIFDLFREVQFCLDTVQARLIELTDPHDRWQDYPLDSGVLKFSGGKERKRFDNEGLVGKYGALMADSIMEREQITAVVSDDGENIIDRFPKIVYAIVHKMAEACGALAPSFDNWRTGIAKEFGIRLSDYAELDESPIRVRIEGRDRRN